MAAILLIALVYWITYAVNKLPLIEKWKPPYATITNLFPHNDAVFS